MDTYIVLRDTERAVFGDPFGGATPGGPVARPSAPPEPRIDVERLDQHDRAELLSDPQVAAVAPLMPTRLLEPVELDTVGGVEAAGDVAWGVTAVGADQSQLTGAGAVVSVLDTGIDASYEAFSGVEIVQRDFSGSGDGDKQGHGTHCAGTIFGRDVDGTRIGVARGVSKALIGKVLGDNGSGDSEMIFRGIAWAVEQGASIIPCRSGSTSPAWSSAWSTGAGRPTWRRRRRWRPTAATCGCSTR